MQRRLLTNGNAFKRTDDRWGGVVWYMDEHGERKRKSFSGTTKAEVNKKMTDYIKPDKRAFVLRCGYRHSRKDVHFSVISKRAVT